MNGIGATFTAAELKASPEKVRQAIRSGSLTAEEEKVLRLRYGLTESDDAELEFRGQDNDLTRIQLAKMERENLKRLRGNASNPRKDKLVQVKDLW